MKYLINKNLLGVSLLLSLLTSANTLPEISTLYQIEYLEPASWWVGMNHQQLQLMVHGEDIARLTPEVSYPGISLDKVDRVDNSNYVFLELTIGDDAKTGELEIRFKDGNQVVMRHPYPLLARCFRHQLLKPIA